MNKERLLNVAKALREAPAAEMFDMGRHVHLCGTPSCAFGHYAARRDLQNEFSIDAVAVRDRLPYQGVRLENGVEVCFSDYVVLDHFGLSESDAGELFGSAAAGAEDPAGTHGRLARTCKTAVEAAEYIERFVAGRQDQSESKSP